jgi:small-conductance mechanosensitive channel
MRADNSAHLVAAARKRAANTRRRAAAALRRMDAAGQPINFDALAAQAGVSRSWLYAQPDLRAEVERLRQRRRSPSSTPDRQRASAASLRARLNLALERIQALEADNRRLRQALAEALGERRGDTPTRQRISVPN